MKLKIATDCGNLRICLVGAGNVATHLALTLAQGPHRIVGVYSRTMKSASELADKLSEKAVKAFATNELNALPEADVYILSVKDQALASLVEAWPQNRRGGVVLHTAGSLPMANIAAAAEHYGVLYPMQTFSKDKVVDFNSVTCFIEGNDSIAEAAAYSIAMSLGAKCVPLNSEDRQFLHLAAVFACNFSNHMYTLAYELLELHGIEPECMKPLIAETAAKVSTMHPRAGQTGPAQRGDENIMEKHLAALKFYPDLQELYSLISQSIMRRSCNSLS